MLYLDHAASSPLRPEAWAAMAPFRDDDYGNPSGGHAVSRRAKNALEDARDLVADILKADPLEIVFTGGGTEADNLAVKGPALAGGARGGIVTSTIEHDAVLGSAGFSEAVGCPLAMVKVDGDGLVDPKRGGFPCEPGYRGRFDHDGQQRDRGPRTGRGGGRGGQGRQSVHRFSHRCRAGASSRSG